MLVRSILGLLLVVAGACFLPLAPHAMGAEQAMLDGKSFVGEFVHKGKTSGDKDTLSFANGRFR